MTATVRIRILDEVYVAFVGLHPSDLTYFYNEHAVFAPNYFFNPRFKIGQWDGKIRFFEKTGRTFLYLLEDILPKLIAMGYKIAVEDLRQTAIKTPTLVTPDTFSHIMHPLTGKPIELRDYQVESVNNLLTEGFGIIKAATGAGKTLITAALVKAWGDVGHRTITIVPDGTLIQQTKAMFKHCELDTGEYSGDEKSLDHQHVVSTWQALKNNPGIINSFQVVIVDECHGTKGPVLRELIIDYAANIPHRYGVTGTLPPEPSDALTVITALGPVRYDITARQLIDAGVLAELHIDVIQLEEDLTEQYNHFCGEVNVGIKPTYVQFKDGYFPDFAAEKAFLQRCKNRVSWIADYLISTQDTVKSNTLVLVDSIPLGKELAEIIPGSIFVNGKDVKKIADRKKIYDMFKTHDNLVVIATVHIAGTGLDIPRVFNLVLVDVGKSFIRVVQGIGRGLRKADDKDSVSIVDIAGDLKYSKKHLAARIKIYKEAGYPYTKHKINYNKFYEKGSN
jgi:superfamily II DNA or RNA helicase